MRIVFWGSSDFSLPVLHALIDHHQVIATVTNPDCKVGRGMNQVQCTPMKICSVDRSIACLQPENLRDEAFQKTLEELNADINVIVSYGKIIPESLIYGPKYDSINLHASRLPKYRGASPIHAALLHGDQTTGNSVQYITKALDKGDVIAESLVPVSPEDNYSTLMKKLSEDGVKLMLEALRQIESGEAVRTPQSEDGASYVSIIRKKDGWIDFERMSAAEIWGRYRAFIEWPGIFSDFAHSEKKVLRVSFTKIAVNAKINGEPGTILKADKEGFIIACREGSLEIQMLKPAGKKDMDFTAFVNGYRPQVGAKFSPMQGVTDE